MGTIPAKWVQPKLNALESLDDRVSKANSFSPIHPPSIRLDGDFPKYERDNMGTIVTPGTVVGNIETNTIGSGVEQRNGEIIALLTGTLVENDGEISVETHNALLRVEVGDLVIGEVVKLNEKSGEIKILSVEGKPNRSIMADQEYAQFHVTKICDRFLHNTADGLRRRDIVRAKVIESGNVVRIDMREDDNCGVLHSICPSCGAFFEPKASGDWNVICMVCGDKTFRALADDFGGKSGMSALNGSGKRWGAEAEARFAKGSSGRATFISEDVREDGSERVYFKFEGEGGQSGRGPKRNAAPGCKLFVGGLSRDVDEDDVRSMFQEHGKITDFALMRDDDGNLRGFGFVTYQKKEMADNAIKSLNGKNIKGRRIGVRDADAPREEKSRKEKPDGARLYVGNLPFKATEKDLQDHFAAHCDSVHIHWATDKSGRKKAFAFVTIKPKEKGEQVAKQLNGTDLMGRNIRVDMAKPSGFKRGGTGDSKGGKSAKSARELRALAEEEEDAKKKKRRPKRE